MAYDASFDQFELPWTADRLQERQRQYEDMMRQQRNQQRPTEPPPKTIGSARVIGGTLKLMFTDGTRIDIPMAVVSEIVAVVLAGRLAMGLSEAEPAS